MVGREGLLHLFELKQYQMSRTINWLSQGVRPDLSYTSHLMSKKNNPATIADLLKVNSAEGATEIKMANLRAGKDINSIL